MADIPKDLGQLAKEIQNYQVDGTESLRHLSEMGRALFMDVAEIIDAAEFETRSALMWFDRGSRRRAMQVTRPLRHAQSLSILAAKRCVAMYRTYLRAFEDELNHNRNRGQRRFNPEK